MLKFAFIVKSGHYDPAVHHIGFASDLSATEVYGVSTVDQAIDVARKLVSRGIELIDLCGAFGEEGMQAVVDAIGCDVPVGYVVYSRSESEKLNRLFAPK